MYSDSEIRETIARLKKREPSLDFIDASLQCFAGASCLVVSAGPSALHWEEIYSSTDKPVIVVCVKQAIELPSIEKICHIHFCNPWNLKKYSYNHRAVLRLFTSCEHAPRSFQSWDAAFNVVRAEGGLEVSLLSKKDFDQYTIASSGYNRPWGPGIMIETVLYALMHMGFVDITTVGWDFSDGSLVNHHFYDRSSQRDASFLASLPVAVIKRKMHSLYSMAPGLSTAKAYVDYLGGRKYNTASMLPGEAELLSHSVPEFIRWMNDKGVNISVISGSSLLKLPRS